MYSAGESLVSKPSHQRQARATRQRRKWRNVDDVIGGKRRVRGRRQPDPRDFRLSSWPTSALCQHQGRAKLDENVVRV